MIIKTKFTRGAWAIQDDGYGLIGVIFRKGFGILVGRKDSETVANAHLITAAPELYEALEALLGTCHAEPRGESERRAAIAALAKARGEQ